MLGVEITMSRPPCFFVMSSSTLVDCRGVSDVDRAGVGRAAGLRGDFRRGLVLDVEAHDCRAHLRRADRDRFADAGRAPDDRGDLAGEIEQSVACHDAPKFRCG